MDNESAGALAKDLSTIRRWCTEHASHPPSWAVAYIDANRELLLCLIKQVAAMDPSERNRLQRAHRELDEGIVSDDLSVAIGAVELAHQVMSGNQLMSLTDCSDDDVNMILRPIEYAKYLSSAECEDRPVLSPLHPS